MNTTQRGIVTLLRSAITGEKLPLPDGFDIDGVMAVAQRHSMHPLIFAGAVNCGIDRGEPIMQQLFQRYCKAVVISEGQMREFGRICAAFEENGIDYMPLKGCKMKSMYPKPELRMMGDADILIRMDQYDRIVPLMESLGFRAKGESDHELPWRNEALYVELHKRVIPSYNEDFHAYFGDGWQLAKVKTGTRYAVTAEDEMVYQFTHFSKHYRDGGIGCRHVVDLWVYRRGNPDLDEAYIRRELKKLQLLEFYDNILRLIDVWFSDGQTDAKMDYMTEFVFASGSWGQMESRTLSRAVRDSKHSLLGFSGKLLYLWQTMFPGVELLREKYTILKKAPWMLPLVWIYRPFYKIFCERHTLADKKRNLDALTSENMDQRREMLNYVGLDYRF